jgi:hypothetical protein
MPISKYIICATIINVGICIIILAWMPQRGYYAGPGGMHEFITIRESWNAFGLNLLGNIVISIGIGMIVCRKNK